MPDSVVSTVRSVTKTVCIACAPQAVFAFVADIGNWPRWAVVNVLSARREEHSQWWDVLTPHGAARIRMRAEERLGILDHDFDDPLASWTVPARVIAHGTGAQLMMTFFQPPGFTDALFDEQVALLDVELATLKALLERQAGSDERRA